MQRLLLLAFYLLFIQLHSLSQTGCPIVNAGPDVNTTCANPCANLNATYFQSGATTSYTVAPIAYTPLNYTTGTPVLVNIDDTWSGVINLPFSFCFFGTVYNDLVIGSNGIISFDASLAGGYCDWDLTLAGPLPDVSVITNSIMGPYQDIDPTFQGLIYYELGGTAPCRYFKVSFYQVPYYGDPNSISTISCPIALYATSQIVLYETTNAIDIYIENKETCSGWNNGLGIEGIQNATGTVAFCVPGRNNTVWTAVNDAYRFTPSGPSIVSVQWFNGATLVANGAAAVVCPATTTTYTAVATYTPCAGGANVVVNDNVTVNVGGGTPVTASIASQTSPSCIGGNNGTASVNVNTGAPPYNYLWSPSGGAASSATGLSAGNYTVTITDANGCIGTVNITIAPGLQLAGNALPANVTCNGLNNGSASINMSNGAAPYTYLWSPSGSGSNSSNLSPANYTVTVTDNNNCSTNIVFAIAEPALLTASNISSDANCSNAGGIATITPNGGTPPYSYSWSPSGGSASTNNNLASGNYTVTVTDDNNCTATTNFIINLPGVLVINGSSTDVTCNGANDGSASVNIVTGNGPYTYAWQPSGGNGASANGLAPGNYTITVTDNAGCITDTTVSIAEPVILSSQSNNTDVLCGGDSTATASISVTGGTTPYTYAWSPIGGTNSNASSLPAGNYAVTVTDDHNCVSVSNFIITEPAPLSLQISPDDTLCQGQQITLSAVANGGIAPYSYLWSNLAASSSINIAPTSTQNYSLLLTDDNGCFLNSNVISVFVYPPLNVAASANSLICAGDSINIGAAAAGGNGGPYSYSWNNGLFSTSTFTDYPFSPTTYTVVVNDGCSPSVTSSTTINVSQIPVVSFLPFQAVGCSPLDVTFTDATTTTSNSIYSWDFGDNTQSNLQNPTHTYSDSGTFSVELTVVNSDGCSSSQLIPALAIVHPSTISDFNLSEEEVGVIHATIYFNENSQYSSQWLWDFGDGSGYSAQRNPEYTYSDTGNFTVRLITNNQYNCPDTSYGQLRVKDELTIFIPDVFTPNNDLINDYFTPLGTGFSNYKLSILDRWGNIIYTGTNLSEPWNGRIENTGTICQNDVYVYKLELKSNQGENSEYIGKVALVK